MTLSSCLKDPWKGYARAEGDGSDDKGPGGLCRRLEDQSPWTEAGEVRGISAKVVASLDNSP